VDGENQLSCSRRDFIKSTGVGVAALSFAGASLIVNANPVMAAALKSDQQSSDILIIGGGMAGTFAALKAKEKGLSVTLVDKGHVGKSGLSPFWTATTFYDSAFKQKYGLSEEKMLKEVTRAQEFLTHQDYWKLWMKYSKPTYEQMKSIGLFAKGLNKRGPALRKALVDQNVTLVERTMITTLIKDDGRIVGAAGFSLDDEKAVVFSSKAVVMCAGAGTFKTPGWPGHSLTHDSTAMAYRVGAEITGKEFVDYHVTNAKSPGGFGVTGGQAPGFMAGDLNYPGIETRGVLGDDQAAHMGDFPQKNPRGGHMADNPNPSGPLGLPRGAVVPQNDPRPMGPPPGGEMPIMVGGSTAGGAPHKCDGIVPADNKCQSNVPGLFAAGDALCTFGAAYAVEYASASMSATIGALAGGFAADYAKGVTMTDISKNHISMIKQEIFAAREREQGFSPRWVLQVLQGIMVPYYVLSVKSEERLKAALTTVQFLRNQFEDNLLASDIHELRLAHETKNLLLNAEMKLRAGLFRTESRGAHYREEFPARDDKNWLAWTIIEPAEDGSMKLTKRAIPEEWKPSAKESYKEKYPYTRYIGEQEYLQHKGIKA
jgi:succinate dehydrogenase/fumarate reductase flavoprotein subunit